MRRTRQSDSMVSRSDTITFQVLPFKLIYHSQYDLRLGSHIFPAVKYSLIHGQLLERGFATPNDVVEPVRATEEELYLVHTQEWVHRFSTGQLTPRELALLELPYSEAVVQGFLLAAGGTTLAGRLALRDGFAFHIGGGFHHAYADHGEGFCAINDIGVAIRVLQKEQLIARAAVVDCDVHHGNGTAAIFAADPSVFTLSIHQLHNYPQDKPPSSLDIDLEDGVGDEEYLLRLGEGYVSAIEKFRPDLIIYVAGADPYREDQLGGLQLTMEGLKRRDRLVLDTAARLRVPAAVVLAGGYSALVRDTVSIHANTAEATLEAWHSMHSPEGL